MVAGPAVWNYDLGRVLMSWFFPSLGGFLYGYDIGAISEVLQALQSAEAGSRWGPVASSAAMQGLVTAMVTMGATAGSIFVFHHEAWLGRRDELLTAAVLYAVGASGEFLAAGVTSLCAARFVFGTAIGLAMHGAPTYIAETAPAKLRGGLVSAKEAMIVAGMLSGYGVGTAWRSTPDGWRHVFALAVPVALVMFVGMAALPRTPRWLVLNRRRDEAKRALRFFSPSANDEEVEELFADDKGEGEAHLDHAGYPEEAPPVTCCGCTVPKTSLLADPASRVGLLAGVGLVVLQQVTGQPSILYYAAQVLESAGLGIWSTVGLAAWKFVCTSLAVTSVDACGRRPLLFAGCGAMACALAALVGCAIAPEGPLQSYFTLASMFLFIGGYQVGFGPVTWTVISECFPLATRGRALAVATITNFSLNALVALVAAPLLAVSKPVCFGAFFLLTLYSIRFVNAYVPETRGLTLEQITAHLQDRAAKGHGTAASAYGALCDL